MNSLPAVQRPNTCPTRPPVGTALPKMTVVASPPRVGPEGFEWLAVTAPPVLSEWPSHPLLLNPPAEFPCHYTFKRDAAGKVVEAALMTCHCDRDGTLLAQSRARGQAQPREWHEAMVADVARQIDPTWRT